MKRCLTLFMLIIFILSISINVQAEEYVFPRNSGNHFTFETDWENQFNKTQYNHEEVFGTHYFTIHNLENPRIQFKRLAGDMNDCYNNRSWIVEVILYHEDDFSTIPISNEKTELIEIDSGVKYCIAIKVKYNSTLLETRTYNMAIQMNVVSKGIDEPHYFFEEINFERLEDEEEQEKNLYFGVLFIILIIIILLYLIKRYSEKRKEKEGIELENEEKEEA